MPLSLLVSYLLVILLPAIYLYIMATFIYTRAAHVKEGKLISGILLFGAISYTVDFIRHLAPTDHSHILHLFGVLLPMHIAFSLTAHSSYVLVRPIQKIHTPYAPAIFYLFPLIIFCIGIVEVFFIEPPTYTKYSTWILPDDRSLYYISNITALVFLCLNLFLLNKGRLSAKTLKYKSIFGTLCVAAIISFVGLITVFTVAEFVEMPPTNGLHVILFFGTVITFLMLRHDFLTSSAKRYTIMLDTSPVAIITLNHNRKLIEANNVALNQFQLSVGKSFEDQLCSYQHALLFQQLKTNRKVKNFEFQVHNKDGQVRYFSIDASAIHVIESDYYFVMLRDITSEREQQQLNIYLAYHDQLTGSNNRSYFQDHVDKALSSFKDGQLGAFVLADLNYFKLINDQYGHIIGDQVLIHVASIFKNSLPDPKIFARLGGDEFVVFYETIHSKEQFIKVIDNLRLQFKLQPFQMEELVINVEPSIGISYVGLDSHDYDELYHIADMRMYEDKKRIKKPTQEAGAHN